MQQPIISIIVAIQEKDRAIGYNNYLLFKISEDQKRFKTLTTGHTIIMGRKTFESIGRALPNRTNIVITRNTSWNHEGVLTAASLDDALSKIAANEQEIFIIGGSEIYNQALPIADRLYLTVVKDSVQADTFFPPYETLFSEQIERGTVLTDPVTGVQYHHDILEKAKQS